MTRTLEISLSKLKDSIENQNTETIDFFSNLISENFSELILSFSDDFCSLPLQNILSIISKSDFTDFSYETLKQLIKNILDHHKEKETILLLNEIHCEDCDISYEDYFDIISLFSSSDIINILCKTFKNHQELPVIDYQHEYLELQEENKLLHELLKKRETEIKEAHPELLSDIFQACQVNNFDSVQHLILYENIPINITNNQSKTPLHIACEYGNYDIAKFLVDNGADLFILDNLQRNPLYYACDRGYLDIVKLTLGQIDNEDDTKTILDPKTGDGKTILHIACQSKNAELFKYLMENYHLSETKDKYKNIPLHIACSSGALDIVKYLIENQQSNIQSTNNIGETPLHIAAKRNYYDIVKYLLSKGADKNSHTEQRKLPIDLTESEEIKNLLSS